MATTTISGPSPEQDLDKTPEGGGEVRISAQSTRREATGQATTMKAIVQDQYGSADVLKRHDINKPVVGVDDILVRVHAAGVHIGDWHLMTGQP